MTNEPIKLSDQELTSFSKHLGERIAEMRKQRNLTQEQLAGMVDIDRVSIGYFEQGYRMPRLYNLLVIAKALDCSLAELLKE